LWRFGMCVLWSLLCGAVFGLEGQWAFVVSTKQNTTVQKKKLFHNRKRGDVNCKV
jgi:hypothetical protein